jgi:ABC-type dipeptide/oligopeptide/nickel transport system permease component
MIARALNILGRLLGRSSVLVYIVKRFVASLPVLFLITLVAFLMIRAIPGGPFVTSGDRPVPVEVIRALERYYGLDRPLLLNLPGEPGWQLLHYVDEKITQRIQAVDLSSEFRAALNAVRAESTRVALDPRFDEPLQRITTYQESGVQRDELARLLSDLDAIREAVASRNPALATQIESAITDYRGVDPAMLSTSPTVRNSTRRVLYSDLFQSQFGNYLFNLLRFDFGPSLGLTSRGRPVSEMIAEKLPISISLGVMAVLTALLIGLPLGTLAAIHHNKPIDHLAMTFAVLGRSIPNIVLGPVLIIFFAVKLKLFPVVDPYVWMQGPNLGNLGAYLSTAFLPVIALGTGMSAGIARLTRASLLQVLNEDYIRTARAKGLRERTVIYIHALRNSLIPVITILGPLLAAVLTGTFVVELIFAIPGLGDTFVISVTQRDYNLLVGVTVLYAVFLVVANIFVDVVYTWLDPRIRF